MWSVIWPVAVTRIGFWTWIWSTRDCGQGQEVACWFQCWKNSVSFVWLVYNNGAIDMKMYGSGLEEKLSFKMLGLTFSSKLNWCSYIVSIAKTASKKIFSLKKGQKLAKMTKKFCVMLYISWTINHMIFINSTHV